MNLTKRTLQRAVAERRDGYLWAESPAGFGCRVRASGAAAFIFDYRPGGGRSAPKRRVTIGSPLSLSIDKAREEALKIAGQVAAGGDPALARKEQRRQRAVAPDTTIASLVAVFVEKHHRAKGNRSTAEVERILKRDAVRAWGSRAIAEISGVDVSRLIQSVVERGAPISARKLYIALQRLFRWCCEHGFIAVSPMVAAAKPPAERPRDRVLSDAEIAAIWRASDHLGYPWKHCIRLLILTGARRNEVACATWAEFNSDEWTIPAERSKNARPQLRHVTPQIAAVLETVPKVAPFLFTTTRVRPVSGFSRLRQRVQSVMEDEARISGLSAPASDWTWHDLRRSMVTWIAGAGFPPHVADRLLGHSTGSISGIAAVYQRAAFLAERKAALLAWNAHIEGLTGGGGIETNVVRLAARAA